MTKSNQSILTDVILQKHEVVVETGKKPIVNATNNKHTSGLQPKLSLVFKAFSRVTTRNATYDPCHVVRDVFSPDPGFWAPNRTMFSVVSPAMMYLDKFCNSSVSLSVCSPSDDTPSVTSPVFPHLKQIKLYQGLMFVMFQKPVDLRPLPSHFSVYYYVSIAAPCP